VKEYEISALASTIIVVLGTLWYHMLLRRREVKTVLASWIVSSAAMLLNGVTYWTTPGATFIGFALSFASIFTIGSILIAIAIYTRKDKQKIVFIPFQRKCLIASALILVLWVVVRWGMGWTGMVPFFLTQLLLIVSYSMLIKKYWRATVNNESLVLWWSVFLASAVAVYTAHTKDGHMAWYESMSWWYAIRSVIMCGILLIALHRTSRREARARSLACSNLPVSL
jgi:uncharacterized membrane protein YwaF